MVPRQRFSAQDVRRAAALAGMALTSEEAERFARELAPILEEFLRAGPSGPARGVSARDRALEPELRPDAPDSDGLSKPPSALTADWRAGFVVVPRIPALDP